MSLTKVVGSRVEPVLAALLFAVSYMVGIFALTMPQLAAPDATWQAFRRNMRALVERHAADNIRAHLTLGALAGLSEAESREQTTRYAASIASLLDTLRPRQDDPPT